MKRLQKHEKITFSYLARYETWKLSHNYNPNYTGSCPGMETAGASKIFSSSKEKHGRYYAAFYGDGDSKAYPAVRDIFGPTKSIRKFECAGHYQKCAGSKLLNLKTKNTKGLGGKVKLTNSKTDSTQNYFDIALRSHVGKLAATKSACMASMYHICDYQNNCPNLMINSISIKRLNKKTPTTTKPKKLTNRLMG